MDSNEKMSVATNGNDDEKYAIFLLLRSRYTLPPRIYFLLNYLYNFHIVYVLRILKRKIIDIILQCITIGMIVLDLITVCRLIFTLPAITFDR